MQAENELIHRDILIGICGDIGSGKDTVANHLRNRGFRRLAFADHLKEVCAKTLGLDPSRFFGSQEEKAAPIFAFPPISPAVDSLGDPWPARVGSPWTGRFIAEFVGTECFRRISPNVWSDFVILQVEKDRELFAKMEGASEPAKMSMGAGYRLHVVPDVRFANEFTAIRDAGGVVWRTVRLNEDGSEHGERTGHVSDMQWRDIPPDAYLIAASGELGALRTQTDSLLGDLIG